MLRKIAENEADPGRISASGADDTIEEVRLFEAGLNPMDDERLRFRGRCIDAHDFTDPMFDAARLFISSDQLVIAAPFWDLSYPAVLKTYIENISREYQRETSFGLR